MTELSTHNVGDKIRFAASFDVIKAASKLPEGQVEVVVSTPTLDRQGESIKVEGIDYTRMGENGPVMWSHDYESAPIGKIIKLWKQAGNLKSRVELDMGDSFAAEVYRKVKEGFIKAVSIGGIVKEFGKNNDGTIDFSTIAKMEMIELSFCAIGANPDALVSLKSLENDLFKSSQDNTYEDLYETVLSLQQQVSALEAHIESAKVPEKEKTVARKLVRNKLVLGKSTAKQIDKSAELIISSFNDLLKEDSWPNKKPNLK